VPVGFSIYIQNPDEKKIYTTASGIESIVNKDIVDFRQRRIMDFTNTAVRILTIEETGKEKILIEKRGEEFWLNSPFKGRASNDEVNKILNTLRNDARVKDFVDDEPESLAKYNLDRPFLKINVETDDKKLFTSLFGKIEKKGKEEIVYCKKADSKGVFTMESKILNTLRVQPLQLRERDVLKFFTWKVKRVEIKKPEATLVMERDDEKNWWIGRKEEGKKAKKEEVDNLLKEIRDIRVIDFVDDNPSELTKYGLSEQSKRVSITMEDNTVNEVLFGANDKSGNVYFKILIEPQVYTTAPKIMTSININEEKLIDYPAQITPVK